MDSSNYKIPKRRPIEYGPKVKPTGQPPVARPQFNAPKPKTQHSQNGRPTAVAVITPPQVQTRPVQPPAASIRLHTAQTKAPAHAKPTRATAKNSKKGQSPHKWFKITIITLIVLVVIGAIAGGAYYYYYKKYIPAHTLTQETQQNNTTTPVSNNPILDADYIVYGTKAGSLFVTNRADYAQDPNVASVKVVAKSSYPNDSREITISQQKVASNFSVDPAGLKKMADSIGLSTPITTTNGTSYIITGNATGLTSIGTTLISVRTSASLALTEWQQLFDSLEPVVI